MTSASELFHNRRARFGRGSADPGLDSPPPPERSFLHSPTSHGRRSHRHDLDGCDPLRRYPLPRNSFGNSTFYHRGSLQERGSFRADESPSLFGLEDSVGGGGSRSPHSPSERLPGSVLLARARLRERLRGDPHPGISQHTRASPNIYYGRSAWSDGTHQNFDASGWETDNVTGWWSSNNRTYTTNDSTRIRFSHSKPNGLTEQDLATLEYELFNISNETEAGSTDCSICLDCFSSGDELINLPCGHRFHSGCLYPWVRIRRDCPYCRRVIIVKKITTTMNNPL